MVIRPQKSTVFAWWFCWIFFFVGIYFIVAWPLIEDGAVSHTAVGGVALICISTCVIIVMFSHAFSTYYLDYEGITQKAFFVERRFYWKDFKFIGKHETSGGFWSSRRGLCLRCSTVALPKNMTKKELEKKTHWPLSTTITIEWPHKNEYQFYQEFLSYCGGERDIRE